GHSRQTSTLTVEQKAERFDCLMARWNEAQRVDDERTARLAEARSVLDQRLEDGVKVPADELAALERALSDINMATLAIHQRAIYSVDCSGIHVQANFLVAIENLAKVCCRKSHRIAALLGDIPRFGNFQEEFEVHRQRTVAG